MGLKTIREDFASAVSKVKPGQAQVKTTDAPPKTDLRDDICSIFGRNLVPGDRKAFTPFLHKMGVFRRVEYDSFSGSYRVFVNSASPAMVTLAVGFLNQDLDEVFFGVQGKKPTTIGISVVGFRKPVKEVWDYLWDEESKRMGWRFGDRPSPTPHFQTYERKYLDSKVRSELVRFFPPDVLDSLGIPE